MQLDDENSSAISFVQKLEVRLPRQHYPLTSRSKPETDKQLTCEDIDDDGVAARDDEPVALVTDELDVTTTGLGVTHSGMEVNTSFTL